MNRVMYKAGGTYISVIDVKGIFILVEGEVDIMFRKKSIERLKSGGFFGGEDQMVHKSALYLSILYRRMLSSTSYH